MIERIPDFLLILALVLTFVLLPYLNDERAPRGGSADDARPAPAESPAHGERPSR
jgi:hypothetical protein